MLATNRCCHLPLPFLLLVVVMLAFGTMYRTLLTPAVMHGTDAARLHQHLFAAPAVSTTTRRQRATPLDVTVHMAFAYPSTSLLAHPWTKDPPNAIRAANTCVKEVLLTVDRKDKVSPSVLDDPGKMSLDLEWQAFKSALLAIQAHSVAEVAKYCPSKQPPRSRIELMTLESLRTIGWESYGLSASEDVRRQQMFKNSLMYSFASATATTKYLFHIDDDWDLLVGPNASFIEKSVDSFEAHPHLVVSSSRFCTPLELPTAAALSPYCCADSSNVSLRRRLGEKESAL